MDANTFWVMVSVVGPSVGGFVAIGAFVYNLGKQRCDARILYCEHIVHGNYTKRAEVELTEGLRGRKRVVNMFLSRASTSDEYVPGLPGQPGANRRVYHKPEWYTEREGDRFCTTGERRGAMARALEEWQNDIERRQRVEEFHSINMRTPEEKAHYEPEPSPADVKRQRVLVGDVVGDTVCVGHLSCGTPRLSPVEKGDTHVEALKTYNAPTREPRKGPTTARASFIHAHAKLLKNRR